MSGMLAFLSGLARNRLGLVELKGRRGAKACSFSTAENLSTEAHVDLGIKSLQIVAVVAALQLFLQNVIDVLDLAGQPKSSLFLQLVFGETSLVFAVFPPLSGSLKGAAPGLSSVRILFPFFI